jgi:hypothetical protein
MHPKRRKSRGSSGQNLCPLGISAAFESRPKPRLSRSDSGSPLRRAPSGLAAIQLPSDLAVFGPPLPPKRSWHRSGLAADPAATCLPKKTGGRVPRPKPRSPNLSKVPCRFRPRFRSAPLPAEAVREFPSTSRWSGPIIGPEGPQTPVRSRSSVPVPGVRAFVSKISALPGLRPVSRSLQKGTYD